MPQTMVRMLSNIQQMLACVVHVHGLVFMGVSLTGYSLGCLAVRIMLSLCPRCYAPSH